jgi:SAM-dependent methyltransferase
MELLLAPPSRAVAYVGLDLAELRYHNAPDVLWDGWTVPLGDSSIDTAICTEVLEHCQDPARVLSETRRVLKPGGFFLLTVPFLWPLHDPPYDEYRFTPFALRRMLKQADFGAVEIWAMGGWDAALAQMIGLWVRRRPMREITRRVLQKFLVPAYRWLLAIDRPPSAFDGSTMATGFGVIARAGTS